ncbi:MAG: hypothetical protein AB7L65_10080 [Hyphomonadaceae bacterium]
MAALLGSQIVLFLAAGLIGFALGWQIRAAAHAVLADGIERDIDELRRRVGEAHVRRARNA